MYAIVSVSEDGLLLECFNTRNELLDYINDEEYSETKFWTASDLNKYFFEETIWFSDSVYPTYFCDDTCGMTDFEIRIEELEKAIKDALPLIQDIPTAAENILKNVLNMESVYDRYVQDNVT